MRQMAERAGIALGGIYNHIGSKEDIFTAITVDFHPIRSVLPALEAAHGETVEEVVQQPVAQMYATLNQSEDFLNLMLIEVVEFNRRHFPSLFAHIFPRALQFSKRLKEKKGPLRQDPPLLVMQIFLLGHAATNSVHCDHDGIGLGPFVRITSLGLTIKHGK